jgi:hypothetical protein
MKSFKQYIIEGSFGHTLWIDPKGKVYDMNSRKEITDPKGHAYTHYDWVNANFDKYFGKLDPKSDEVYNKPMEMGWARIRNGRVSLDVEVNIKKLNRSQKKVIRSIVDTNHKRPLYIDTWVKNKTSRAGDLGFNNYDDVVDFLSEAASYRGDMLIGWIDPKGKPHIYPTGKGTTYHTQILTNIVPFEEMEKHIPDAVGSMLKKHNVTGEKAKKAIETHKRIQYDKMNDARVDGNRDVEHTYENMGWVKFRIDRVRCCSSIQNKDLKRCHNAAKILDKKLGGWQGISTIRIYPENGTNEINDEKTWDTYIKTGRIPKRTEIGQTMSKFR